MQLQAILGLDKEWNSAEMLKRRGAGWNDQNEADKDEIEGALEFLEKVSTLEKNGVISCELIWDTFGWYVWRCWHYSSPAIKELRKDWTPRSPDPTLYQDLETLSEKLLKHEIKKRKVTKRNVIEELNSTREKFVRSERRLS